MLAPASSSSCIVASTPSFGAVASARHARAEFDARGRHQRRDAFLARQIDERLVLQQQLDELGIAGPRGAQQRRGALRQDRVAAAILRHIAIRRTPLELNIRIGAGLEQHPADIERGERILARDHGHGAVALHRQRADVGGHVHRRPAVEVPFVDDRRRALIMYAANSKCRLSSAMLSGVIAIRIFEIGIGAGRDQVPRALDTAFARGIEQRREPALVHVFRTRLGDDLAFPLVDDAARVDVGAACDARNFTISAWLCAAAHISADCPPQVSLALTSAPASSSRLAASTLPLRAAAISGVSPSGFLVLGSAPALSSASMIGAEPMIAASVSADVPNWFFSLTFAPALISARTSSRSSFAAAHMMAVVPSGAGRVRVRRPSASRRSAAARSPGSAASSNVDRPRRLAHRARTRATASSTTAHRRTQRPMPNCVAPDVDAVAHV